MGGEKYRHKMEAVFETQETVRRKKKDLGLTVRKFFYVKSGNSDSH